LLVYKTTKLQGGIMDTRYSQIKEVANRYIYKYIKENDSSLLGYDFEGFFNHIVESHNIKVMDHHFSSRKIEGLTLIDESGVSFSYERENPQVKQNFTKCHELGHFLLKHSGSFFTELKDESDSIFESEANLFSAFVLMPSIVLLSKIFYRHDSFSRVMKDLKVSAEALVYRLRDLFSHETTHSIDEVNHAIQDYKNGQLDRIVDMFGLLKSSIIEEYKQVTIDMLAKVYHLLIRDAYLSDRQIHELKEKSFRQALEADKSDISCGQLFDYGKVIYFAWKKDKLTERQAVSNAKTQLLLERV
jgi:putative transcriptional regulator